MKARIAKIAISAALVTVALLILDPTGLMDKFRKVDPFDLLGALGLSLVSIGFLAVRWNHLIRNVARAKLREHLRIFLYGSFLGFFAPGTVGNDAYRVVVYVRKGTSLGSVIGAVIRERLFGFISTFMGYLLCVGVSLAQGDRFDGGAWIFLVAAQVIFAALACVFAVMLLADRIGGAAWLHSDTWWLKTLSVLSESCRFEGVREFSIVLAYSLAALAAWLAMVALVAHSVAPEITLGVLGAIAILAELIRLIPITFQGIGLREGAFAYLVMLAGGTAEFGFLLGFISYALLSLALVLAAPLSWLVDKKG